MNKYKSYFIYNILYSFLKDCNDLKEINYANFKDNYNKIIDLLKKVNNGYFNLIQSKEKEISKEMKVDKYKFNFIKYPKKNNVDYIINFEIINKEIFSFFKNNNIIKEQRLFCNYIAGDGKILIIFYINKKGYYEIGHFDKLNNSFIIEYLIEEKQNEFNNIFSFFNLYGIRQIVEQIFKYQEKIYFLLIIN